VGSDAAGIVGHLAHPDRRRVLAALILGASTTDDVKRVTGLETRADDTAALRRYLVDEGFLDREAGDYWRAGGSYDV